MTPPPAQTRTPPPLKGEGHDLLLPIQMGRCRRPTATEGSDPAIHPIERHLRALPALVPFAHVGLELLQEVGAGAVLGGQALVAELFYFGGQRWDVDGLHLMVLDA